MRELGEREKWFVQRIGKTVYRQANGCDCAICEQVRTKGLVIEDIDQALYLAQVEASYKREGFSLTYVDEPQDK